MAANTRGYCSVTAGVAAGQLGVVLQLAPREVFDRVPTRGLEPEFATMVAVGAIGVGILGVLMVEAAAAYRGWRALRAIETQRDAALEGLENLSTTVDDVIMMSSGTQAKLVTVAEGAVDADTRPELAEAVDDALATIRALPFDKPGYQALDGSWALEEQATLAEQELVTLDQHVERHRRAIDLVTFHRLNLLGRAIHGLLYLAYTPRWLAGRLDETRQLTDLTIETGSDDGAGDRLKNVHTTRPSSDEAPSAADAVPPADDGRTEPARAQRGEQPEESFLEELEWMDAVDDDSDDTQ
jgi:hypothetical protein